jgi:hypothetical protein
VDTERVHFSVSPMANILTNSCTKVRTESADDRTEMRVDGFGWNEGNRSKCQKHGVSVEAVEARFGGELMVLPDPEH